uniref:FYVE-type domain-containing protein n=1 Tax=Globisporangium ultimum (strain ATCC 200006 / CBS 805.95 / DAOM BR144) TaxID=431595 RepID=K3W6G2_GLOUD
MSSASSSSSSAGNALAFPLYQGFFPQLVLSVDELIAYRRLGKERVSQLVRIIEDADCVYNWVDVKTRPNGARGSVACQKAQCVDIRPATKAPHASTFVKSSVHIVDVQPEELLTALARAKTKEFRKAMAYLHGESFVDAQTLLTFPTSATSTKPAYSYRAIKWYALKEKHRSGDASSKKKKTLDFCVLEYAGRKKAHPGSDVLGFIVQESLPAEREVPHLDAYGILRGHVTRTGIIISRTHQSNILKVTSICQIDGALSGAIRTAMDEIMLESVAAIHRVKGLLERQRMGKLQYLEEWEWVANSERKACAVCLRGFYFHRKHHCQTCGEVVCSSCAPLRELDEPLFDTMQIRVCTVCLASVGSQAAASTERTSSNGGTNTYIQELQRPSHQHHSYNSTRPSRSSEESRVPMPRHRMSNLSDEQQHAAGRRSDLFDPRRVSHGSSSSASRGGKKTETLSKLAYHIQQIRETINVAISEVDQSANNNKSFDDVYERILQIRETLDISGSEFDAVLASIASGDRGGGSRRSDVDDSDYHYSSSMDRESLYSSEGARSSFSQSSLGNSSSTMGSDALLLDAEPAEDDHHRSSLTSSSLLRHGRSPMHKDSRFSDQTVASSASKQSSELKHRQPFVGKSVKSEYAPVVSVNQARGIHRLAQKIEKLQQRLEDSHRAASVVDVSDLESEPEPDARSEASMQPRRRPSMASGRPPLSENSRITAEMVEALRGVMASSELTKPPAWRKSFSSSGHTTHPHNNDAASIGSRASSSRHGAASSGGGSTTMFVYDEDSVTHKFQRVSVEKPGPRDKFQADDEDVISLSSSEGPFSLAMRGRDGSEYLYESSLSSERSLEEDVASLPSSDYYTSKKPSYYANGKPTTASSYSDESDDDLRGLLEDLHKLPARMRTSSGQSSGAPSQENYNV